MAITVISKSKSSVKSTSIPKTPAKNLVKEANIKALLPFAKNFVDVRVALAKLEELPEVQEYLELLTKKKEADQALKEAADEVLDPEKSLGIPVGNRIVKISAKGKETKIKPYGGKEALYSILGDEGFAELATFPITKLRSHLQPSEMDKVCDVTLTKSRTVKLV